VSNLIPRKEILCACGCGGTLIDRNDKGNVRRFIKNHHNSTPDTRAAARLRASKKGRPRPAPWNRGRSYVMAKRTTYANKGTWNKAMRRVYGSDCMRCGWAEANCDTHHLVAKKDGGQFTLENGVILCPNCHRLANLGILSAQSLREIKSAARVIGEMAGAS